ncbi:MAG TPA: hypothetical protein VK870_12730 [Ignavibacteriaceae bacterium]|nr:hypothetical protein [Ignavibacteriaceae bacterium]
MFVKIKIGFLLALFYSGLINAQLVESLEKEAVDIMLSLSTGDALLPEDLRTIKELLNSDFNEYKSSGKPADTVNKENLINHLAEFESELNDISTDSALVLFNQWYLCLSNTFYEYNKEKFFSSTNKKIILFSTSMSCYCTLEMCKEQTIQILKFIRSNNNSYDYWIIDSFEHNELQIEYFTLFAPSVIVFDENNEVLYKIEYEEKMLAQLTDYFNNNIYKK